MYPTSSTISRVHPLLTVILFLLPNLISSSHPGAAARSSSLKSHSLLFSSSSSSSNQQPETTTPPPPPVELPDFVEPIGNHTVAVGRDAQLACKINKLGSFRTAWLRVEDKGILTIHNNIITRNYRVGLDNDNPNHFILTIKNVQPSDRVSSSSLI